MTKEELFEILKQSDADDWSVTDVSREGWEFYFIRHNLDQNRIRHTEHVNVTVYKKSADGKYLGSAAREIQLSNTSEENRKEIAQLVHEASLVQNPYYELAEGSGKAEQSVSDADVKKTAGDFIQSMMQLPETSGEDVNSYEIFTDKVSRRIVTSRGIDAASVYPSSMIEVVVNARKDDHEIELYRMYNSGTCDGEGLKRDVTETLHYGKDKLIAEKTPALGKYAVVFSTDAALQIYNWFIDRMNAAYVYQKISDCQPGKAIAEDVKGDSVTLKAVRELPNSSSNTGFDAEGAALRDLSIIENNTAKNYYGNRQFAQYLGLKDSFIPGNWEVAGGSRSADELRSGDYLEVVEFSDFQVSAINGDIAGEIRLGYLHQNGKTTVVSGGSVSGTMNDFVKEMYLSKEQKQYDNMLIPAVTRLENVTVTGAE